jgi:hypothetical protein
MPDESELDRSGPAGLRWPGFTITGPHPGEISLRQIDSKSFVLEQGMTIRYDGATGLEGLDRVDEATIEMIRSLTSAELQSTDLASVPGLLRWFTNTYGLHTPAALVAAIAALIGGFDLPNDVDPALLLVASLVAPFVFSVLWGRQYGAGLVASFVAPWILPPAVFALLGYIVYWVIEWVISPLTRD